MFQPSSAIVPAAFMKLGADPTVPASWSMRAIPPFQSPPVAVVVNAANSPSGEDAWQPIHSDVVCGGLCCEYCAGVSTGPTVSSPGENPTSCDGLVVVVPVIQYTMAPVAWTGAIVIGTCEPIAPRLATPSPRGRPLAS